MWSPISHLADVLKTVRECAQTFESDLKGNEAATRAALIDPVLRALGWDIADPSRVLVEKTKTVHGKPLKVDYALLDDEKIKIVVEAKKLGGDLKHDFLQLVNYTFGLTPQSIFITDGRVWHHYQNLSSSQQDPIQKFNLTSDPLPEMAAYLVQHLDAALLCLETPKIDELRQRVVALESALAGLRAQALTQIAPAPEVVAVSKAPQQKVRRQTGPVAKSKNVDTTNGENWFSLDGLKVSHPIAVQTTIGALRELAKISDAALPCIEKAMLDSFAAKKKKVVKRRWIAQTKEALYDNPKLLSSSVEIVPGWWLGTNYANGDKREMLGIAAKVAEEFGVKLEFYLV